MVSKNLKNLINARAFIQTDNVTLKFLSPKSDNYYILYL